MINFLKKLFSKFKLQVVPQKQPEPEEESLVNQAAPSQQFHMDRR